MADPQCRPHEKWLHALCDLSLAIGMVFLGSGHCLGSDVSRRQMLKTAAQASRLAQLLICDMHLD